MDQETPSVSSAAPASKQSLYSDVVENWKTGHRLKAALLFLIVSVLFPYSLLRVLLVEKFFWGILFGGIVVTAIVAAGQSWSIGFYPAWKIYKYWWIAAPVYGPAVGFVLGLEVGLIHGIEWLFRRFGKAKYAKISMGAFLALGIAVGILFGGYYTARQDNPMLTSQSANLDALNKAVGDQNRVLGNLSDSAKTLLGQLNATETELENAKKQLSTTLANFDSQRWPCIGRAKGNRCAPAADCPSNRGDGKDLRRSTSANATRSATCQLAGLNLGLYSWFWVEPIGNDRLQRVQEVESYLVSDPGRSFWAGVRTDSGFTIIPLFTLWLFRSSLVTIRIMKPQEQRDLFPGALEMMILQTLKRKPLHGYALA
jgi:hypothetical protein